MSNDVKEIVVCMGSACFARGNEQNLTFIENFIQENNLDLKVKLRGSRCEGKCADGPNVFVDGVEYNRINEAKLKEILQNLK